MHDCREHMAYIAVLHPAHAQDTEIRTCPNQIRNNRWIFPVANIQVAAFAENELGDEVRITWLQPQTIPEFDASFCVADEGISVEVLVDCFVPMLRYQCQVDQDILTLPPTHIFLQNQS
jgi:hypothetical protein